MIIFGGHTGTGVLCGYADLMMEKLIPVRRTSCRILAPYSFASLMISTLRSRLYNCISEGCRIPLIEHRDTEIQSFKRSCTRRKIFPLAEKHSTFSRVVHPDVMVTQGTGHTGDRSAVRLKIM